MKKSQNNFLIVLVIFLASIALLFFVYKAGTFSHYNALVDHVIGDIAGLFGARSKISMDNDESSEDFNEFPDIDFSEYSDIDIAEKNPVFCGRYSVSAPASAEKVQAWFKTSDFDVRARCFSYKSEWRYIAEPFVFGKYFAIFTGEPELQIFNYSSGLIYSCPVPVYPDKILFFDENLLVFAGRDGETYYFSFTGEPMSDANNSEIRKSPKEYFYPDEKCTAAIKSRLDMWTDKKVDKLPAVSFFPAGTDVGTSALYDIESGLSVFAYSPALQGKYKVGFADADGAWSDCSAFVFVFLQDGEMLSMSFEYYADKPQVEVNLSDKEIYYFVCGNMSTSEIPENTRIAIRGL